MIAPEIFELDDVDGHARPVGTEVLHAHRDSVRVAVQSCPEQAITLTLEESRLLRAADGQRAEDR